MSAADVSILNHVRRRYAPHAFRCLLPVTSNARPVWTGVCCGQPLPIVFIHLCQKVRDLLVEEDKARVTVCFHAFVRPIVTAESDHLAIHDNRLIVTGWLEPNYL